MWIAIGILAGVVVANSFVMWLLVRRVSEAEMFLLVISGAVLNDEQQALVNQFIRTRKNHPSGKKIIDGEVAE